VVKLNFSAVCETFFASEWIRKPARRWTQILLYSYDETIMSSQVSLKSFFAFLQCCNLKEPFCKISWYRCKINVGTQRFSDFLLHIYCSSSWIRLRAYRATSKGTFNLLFTRPAQLRKLEVPIFININLPRAAQFYFISV